MAATYPIAAAYLAGQRRPQPRGEHPSRPSARRLVARADTRAHPQSNRHRPAIARVERSPPRAQRRTSITATMNARTPPAT